MKKTKLNLKEEKLSGFLVTTDRKKLWACELDLLEQLDAVCKKHHLNFFLIGGTMLGAIRHKGFIPWDDDIDVAMMREDYDKLLKIADKEFKKPYFLATSLNDKHFIGHAQLKNLNTAAINEEEKYLDYKKCIFIDIFVFDKVSEDEKERNKQKKQLKFYNMLLRGYYFAESPTKKLSSKLFRFGMRIYKKFIPFAKLYRKYEKIATRFNNTDTRLVSNPLFYVCYDKDIAKYDDLKDLVDCKFEYLTVKIPKTYDDILTRQYGDYMKPVMGTQLHSIETFDTEKSYTEYLKEKEK